MVCAADAAPNPLCRAKVSTNLWVFYGVGRIISAVATRAPSGQRRAALDERRLDAAALLLLLLLLLWPWKRATVYR